MMPTTVRDWAREALADLQSLLAVRSPDLFKFPAHDRRML